MTLKLYFSPGACSLSPHIALREAGLPFELVKVDTKTKQTATGEDYTKINPKGYVPTLELDNGERLTEGPAIVQYIADQVAEKQLAPANGSIARYRLQEWLNFITSELHKNYSPLFGPTTPEDYKPLAREKIKQRLTYVDGVLANQPYLLGSNFSVADLYLFVVTGWSKHVGIDISDLRHVGAFLGRIAERPTTQAALKAEGLSK